MSYAGAFAAFYDRLTANVDYAARAQYFDAVIRRFSAGGEPDILLDVGCGTGRLTAEMARLGYDVIGVDASADMLARAERPSGRSVLYLCQLAEELDLYGTVDAAICALDTLNHITDPAQLEKALARISLFTVPDGVFVFDVNTPYKHRKVLADSTFVYDLDEVYCVWQNATDESLLTEISLDFFVRRGNSYTRESEVFFERGYTHEQWCALLKKTGWELLEVYAADSFHPLGEADERAVYVARKVT